MSENYQVLYRKYRPERFDQVFGQDHIVKVLKGSLELGNIGHAYLFSGPRGTGKTTIARIFARELGCSDTDIIEIDAASNRGIDDIRSLRESVHSLPFQSRYKMYIIDEVHMLTKEAFNALLKTLEEPPTHVIFVLATTEIHKILPTIVSRCQSFVFKSPSYETLRLMIQGIVEKEGFTIDAPSLDIIAMLGNGSFRDTQGVLQKLISYSQDKNITQEEVELVTGAPSRSLVQDFIKACTTMDTSAGLGILKKAEEGNIDPLIFLQMITQEVRNILLIRFSSERAQDLKLDLGEDIFQFLESLARERNTINSQTLEHLLVAYRDMNYAYLKYTVLELAFFKIIGNNS